MIEVFQKMTSIDWLIFVVTITAYIVLDFDIFKNNGISQNFYTWFLWGILDIILFITTHRANASDQAIIIGCVFGSFSVAFLLLLIKKVRWRKMETQTLILVIITLTIWLWSKSNLVGIISAVSCEIVAGIPLMKSSWKTPGSKMTLVSYLTFIISYILTIFKAPNWSIENVLFPISFLVYSIVDTLPLVRKWVEIYKRYFNIKNG